MIHIAGVDVQVGHQVRQRCSWCGAVLLDYDLATIAQPLNADGSLPAPPAMWGVGALVSVDDGCSYVVAHTDGAPLPEGACAQLPHEVTGMRG